MQKLFTMIVLAACVRLGRTQNDPDVAVDAVAPPKPPCACILPILLVPGGGPLPGGLLPGGISIELLNNLLQGGILNKNNIDINLLKLILGNPALLSLPGVINILTNALAGGALSPAPAPVPAVAGPAPALPANSLLALLGGAGALNFGGDTSLVSVLNKNQLLSPNSFYAFS